MLFNYDNKNLQSIYEYAKKLENMTFREITEMYDKSTQKHYIHPSEKNYELMIKEDEAGYITNSNAKGQLGGLLERKYFGYDTNGKQEADFNEVGLELKQTCVDLKKDGTYRAGERLSITNISFKDPVIDNFYNSHLWNKIKLILLVQYLRDKTLENRLDYKILFVNLFTPPQEDLEIIIQDYNKINQKIKDGKAHELSESDTLYLGACTKGSTSDKMWQPQYYGDHTLAKKRNFCFKQSYMNFILHNYILSNNNPTEKILNDLNILKNESFEDYITNKLNSFIGKTDKELCVLFNREYNQNEAQWSNLTYSMLGIKGNHAEEFEKANIVVKSIRIEANDKIKENMSFPPFKFKELANEEWEDSTLFNYFDTTKFLFVIYKSNGDGYTFIGSQLWNMPYEDLNITVKEGWEKIRDSIRNGVTITPKQQKNGIVYKNSLPKKSDNPIIHIRPHASKSGYKLKDGTIIGNLTFANELPDGQWMTYQSFWINNTYIIKQLKY